MKGERFKQFIRSKRGTLLFLFFLIIVAAIVRLPEIYTRVPAAGIDELKIYWYDEALSIFFAGQSWSGFWHLVGYDTSPPLFYLILWVCRRVLGLTSAIGAPFFFSLAGVAAVYFLAKEFFNKKVGWLSGLFFAFSPLAIDYALELRAYSLLALVAALATAFWWRLLKEFRARNFVLYILFAAMAAYAHYAALALILAQAIIFFIVSLSGKKTISVYAALAAAYLPQIFLFQRWGDLAATDAGFSPLFNRLFSHGSFISFGQFFHSLILGQAWIDTPLVYISGLAMIIILLWLGLSKYREQPLMVLGSLFFLSFINLCALKFIYAPKYYFALLPLFVPLLAFAILSLRRKAAVAAVIFIFIISLAAIWRGYTVPDYNAFLYYGPTFSEILWREGREGDLLLVDHASDILFRQYRPSKWIRTELFFPLKDHLASRDERWRYWDYNVATAENVKLADSLTRGHERVWAINYLPQKTSVQDPHGYLVDYLNKNLKPVRYYYFPEKVENVQQVQLILYEKSPIN